MIQARHIAQAYYIHAAVQSMGLIGAQMSVFQPDRSQLCQGAMTELLCRMKQGIQKYQQVQRRPYNRQWHEVAAFDHAKLLRIGNEKKGAKPVLLVPSFINSAEIFDVHPDQSFAGFLMDSGYVPYIIQWDRPQDKAVVPYGAYVDFNLDPAIDWILDRHEGVLDAVGYCLGGTILALSQRLEQVSHCVFAAAPWDFTKLPVHVPALQMGQGNVTAEQIHMACVAADPLAGFHKFSQFYDMPGGKKADLFVAIEDWLADGRPMSSDLLEFWHGHDWKEGVEILCPALLVLPHRDQLVPYSAAISLQDQCRHAQVFRPQTGHIGFIASQQAQQNIWSEILRFLS